MMNEKLAHFIEDWLLGQDLKQAQLARRAAMAPETLCRVMKGTQHPGPKLLRRLEFSMGLDRGVLASLVDEGSEDTAKTQSRRTSR